MKRVMIIGGSGAGKSTLAVKIGKATGLPVVHIDPMYYQPNWVRRKKSETRALILEATAKERWVFDGNHHSTFDQRLARADMLVFLDIPTPVRLWRVFKRIWRYRGRVRPDSAAGCPERFDFHFFFYWVGGYRWRTRTRDLAVLATAPKHVTKVHLFSPKAVANWLAGLG